MNVYICLGDKAFGDKLVRGIAAYSKQLLVTQVDVQDMKNEIRKITSKEGGMNRTVVQDVLWVIDDMAMAEYEELRADIPCICLSTSQHTQSNEGVTYLFKYQPLDKLLELLERKSGIHRIDVLQKIYETELIAIHSFEGQDVGELCVTLASRDNEPALVIDLHPWGQKGVSMDEGISHWISEVITHVKDDKKGLSRLCEQWGRHQGYVTVLDRPYWPEDLLDRNHIWWREVLTCLKREGHYQCIVVNTCNRYFGNLSIPWTREVIITGQQSGLYEKLQQHANRLGQSQERLWLSIEECHRGVIAERTGVVT